MPAKPEWLLRLPEIRAELEHLDVPVVDRAGIEHIFGLKRRRAIELLHQFGGYQAAGEERTRAAPEILMLERGCHAVDLAQSEAKLSRQPCATSRPPAPLAPRCHGLTLRRMSGRWLPSES